MLESLRWVPEGLVSRYLDMHFADNGGLRLSEGPTPTRGLSEFVPPPPQKKKNATRKCLPSLLWDIFGNSKNNV